MRPLPIITFGWLLLCLFVPRAFAGSPIILWHTLDGPSAKFFGDLIGEFKSQTKIDVRLETGMDLAQTLIQCFDDNTPPDIVLAPADAVGLAYAVDMSVVPTEFANEKHIGTRILKSIQVEGKSYGAPIFDGNILLQLYNRKLISQPANTIEKAGDTAWVYKSAYIFASFLITSNSLNFIGQRPIFAGNTRAEKTLLEYEKLAPTHPHCGDECVTSDFYAGRRPQIINGDWALCEAETALGKDLGVAPLPYVGGKQLISLSAPHVLLFPAKSLTGPKALNLKQLARFLQSLGVQKRWYNRTRRLPVDRMARAAAVKSGGPMAKVISEELDRAQPMPPMSEVWPALNKGLRLFLDGVMSAQEALIYMQNLTTKSLETAE